MADPGDFAYFQGGEPFGRAGVITLDMAYFTAGEPFAFLLDPPRAAKPPTVGASGAAHRAGACQQRAIALRLQHG